MLARVSFNMYIRPNPAHNRRQRAEGALLRGVRSCLGKCNTETGTQKQFFFSKSSSGWSLPGYPHWNQNVSHRIGLSTCSGRFTCRRQRSPAARRPSAHAVSSPRCLSLNLPSRKTACTPDCRSCRGRDALRAAASIPPAERAVTLNIGLEDAHRTIHDALPAQLACRRDASTLMGSFERRRRNGPRLGCCRYGGQ